MSLIRRVELTPNGIVLNPFDGEPIPPSHSGPWRVLYTEDFATRVEAMGREKQLKTSRGRAWIRQKLIAAAHAGRENHHPGWA